MESFYRLFTSKRHRQNFSQKSMGHYAELGLRGHFPLFEKEWIDAARPYLKLPLTPENKNIYHHILNRLNEHNTLAKKKTLLSALSDHERSLFISIFFLFIENKLLERQVIFQ